MAYPELAVEDPSHSSDTLNPWRAVIRIASASRWPYLPRVRAAWASVSTSVGVRCSRPSLRRPPDAPTVFGHCPQNRPRCTPHRPTSRRRSARVQKMVFPHNIRNADSLPTENGQYPVICFLREFRLGDAPKRDPREGTCGFPGAVLVLNVVRAYKGHDSSGRSGRRSRSIARDWISCQTFIASSSRQDSVGFQPRFRSRTE